MRITAASMMNSAYGLRFGPARAIVNQMISGGPSWTETTTFDVDAKADDPSTVTARQRLTMLQNLLAERFKLKFHRETKEVSGFALLVAPSGPKLKEAAADEQTSFSAAPLVKGQKVPVGTLVNLLAQRFGRVVIDKTGLTGLYDFTLTWTPTPN